MQSVAEIIGAGLCVRCGGCIAACSRGATAARWHSGQGWSVTVDSSLCNDCGRCLDVCPGRGLDLDSVAADLHLGKAACDLIGRYDALYRGWASDWTTRWRGASGGVGSAIVSAALDSGLADAALLTRLDGENGLQVAAFHARSRDDVVSAAGSKYCMVPLNAQLKAIAEGREKYVFVGLPCHVHGLRLAQQTSPGLRRAVAGVVSLLCGNVQTPAAVRGSLARHGVPLTNDACLVRMRGGGWPGSVEIRQGDTVARLGSSDFYDAHFQYSALRRCLWCADGTGELADVSLGDAWPPHGAPAGGLGDSLIVVRGQRGAELLGRAREALVLEEVTPAYFLDSQKSLWHLKRRVVPGLTWLARRRGHEVPEYVGVGAGPSTAAVAAALAYELKRRRYST